ncbi:hypothetical protein RDWZM_002750 [Blomia tropicalis]|uniref:Phospholipase A2 n=1 Tax=Blomia tropicalis TaxID=40697 RepID=A0A9Q0MEA8_BLOTA|nr:hypothetical protein RDWZM_002750 [Blomia tropicalis]
MDDREVNGHLENKNRKEYIVYFTYSNNVPQNDRTNLQQIDHLERSSPIIMSHHQMISMPIDVDDHELSNLNHTLHENEIVHTIHNGTQGQVQDTILQQHHQQQQHRRVKRGVLDLASMIRCITGCNPFSYKDYGCYCGFQGDGYPVDGIDRCCYMHDNCYEQTDCHPALVYFKSYKWSCMGYGRAKCSYRSSSSMCGFQLCECDRKFAKCLSRYRCPNSKASCDITKHIIIGK